MERNSPELGLNTKEALNKLYIEIGNLLHQYNTRKSTSWIKDTFHHTSQYTKINWFSGLFQLWIVISLLISSIIHDDKSVLIYEAVFILILLILNVALELFDNRVRHNEVPNRIRALLDKLQLNLDKIRWQSHHYPNLCAPFSPCITLQWTFRDHKLINLPWSLLVKDDVIQMRPGQISPGFCEALDKQSDIPLLHAKEVFSPSLQSANEIFSVPRARKPAESRLYKLLETPYLNNLRVFLEQALDRPVTQHNQQRHLVMIKIIERILLPLVFVFIFTVNLVRYFYLNQFLGRYDSAVLFLNQPSTVILPLLPLVFPIVWNVLNYAGMARFKCIFDLNKTCVKTEEDSEHNVYGLRVDVRYTWKQVWGNFVDILVGQAGLLTRSSNVLHVLGSVTALGCVDKKGILSWPNPTAEKVFFLHNNEDEISNASSLDNVNDLNQDNPPDEGGPANVYFDLEGPVSATAEVLDLTHNHNDAFKLHFDDHHWQKHLNSLKPLGLAILLNTCNIDTQEHYTAFCSHITCEAIYNENLIPVTNRRCLCELAKEIGFVDQAQKIFALEQQLSTFRHLQPEMVRRDNKYARTLNLSTKLKCPFPHMFAVVVKELCSGSMQLLSEGTADIILDSCTDYWDGRDLCPLTQSDRKKIQDFYQRSSLTAYCTAFAYRPLTQSVNSELSKVYLELPSDSRQLYKISQSSPSPGHWDCKSVLEPKIKSNISQFYSTDSLLFNDYSMEDVHDTDSCFQMQCNQIFIGMVTMQYQPLNDMVQLIEQLERACIRFVHFSKENELRSRVFSEKMGLESGWNCHISLLSERNSNLESSRMLSFSAPSAIHLEHSVVKFDTVVETSIEKKSIDDDSQENIPLSTDVNNTTHDWQSLSCLTDSTEQSAPINFDMSNRAKLPRGVDKIRPHIELIDNVPLLVSLFTDCTPSATKEMLHIMQDYREVVCILGSSENNDNPGIFMQADVSIAVEPLYPQVCQKRPVFQPVEPNYLSPIDLSCELNAIGCSLSIRRDDPISFHTLVMEARHFVAILWSSVQFWLCCCVLLSFLQMLGAILMLPPLLSIGQVLWFTCFVIPLLSISLMAVPVDVDVMNKPQGKFQASISFNMIGFMLWCYGTKFMPTVLVVLVSFMGVLTSHCGQICQVNNCTCVLLYNPTSEQEDVVLGGWIESSWTISIARLFIIFIILLHFVVISVGFVHREHLCFQRNPLRNFVWLAIIFILITIQGIYTLLKYNRQSSAIEPSVMYAVPTWVIVFAATSPLFIFIINEIIKRQEIMVNQRFLKRARLDFGTKLGMNSPF